MQTGKSLHAPATAARGDTIRRIREVLLCRLWLPKFVYEALPYLYITCGIVALGSAVYIQDWTWILPWAILVGLICLHAGLALAALRYRIRQGRRKTAPPGEPEA